MKVRHIFRWDLDKTYLKTDFESVRGLYRTARATAEQRENIPGSGALVRAVRALAPEDEQNLVYFVSGSPKQMRAVLEKKFKLDGVAPDGFVLKPTVAEIFRGRFRSIKSQVAYKLGALLRGRADAPIGTQETLIGDDAESDAFIYSLYADLIAGKVGIEELREILRRASAYKDQIRAIEHEMEAIVHENAVRRTIIHLEHLTPPAAFADYFPRLVPIYNHLQTAIVLNLDGSLPPEAIRLVCRELLEYYGFDEQQLVNSAEDIMRRRRQDHPIGALEELGSAIDTLAPLPDSEEKAGNGSADDAERLQETLVKISERAKFVASRPLPKVAAEPSEERSYVELWQREQERREEQKRARKMYQKTGRDGPEGPRQIEATTAKES